MFANFPFQTDSNDSQLAVNVVYLHVRGWTLQYLAMLHSYVGWPGISLTNYGWLKLESD